MTNYGGPQVSGEEPFTNSVRRNRATRMTWSFIGTVAELFRGLADVSRVDTLSRPRNTSQNYDDDVKRTSVQFGSVVVGAILTLTTLGIASTLASGTTRHGPTVAPGTVLTNTSLGGFTQIDQIDMLSPHLGYALATGSLGKDRYAYYLVRTTTLGKSWTVRSEIAASLERYPIFSDYNLWNANASIDFANAQDGYVDGAGGSLDVTNNGGRTWSQITPPNSSTSYAVNGATTSVVETLCPLGSATPTSICKSEFDVYPSGATKPTFSTSLLVPGQRYAAKVELLAAAPHGVDVLNVNAGISTTATALRITHNNGRTWSPMANPCASLAIEQLLVSPNGTWLLSCFLDEGMSQGPGRLLRSTNEGQSWITEFNFPIPKPGKSYRADTPMSLFFGGNSRLLYAAYMNPAGGFAVSSNYGRTFSDERYFGNTGGAPGSISNFGATSSIYQVFGGPAFVTRDAHTWKLMAQLQAGPYRQTSICTKHNTEVLWRSHVVAGLRYNYLDFINHGSTTCYLNGVPTIQPTSSSGVAVGPPLTGENSAAGGAFVLLRANGGVANISMGGNPTSGYRPASSCAAKTARALRINFAPPSHFTFEFGASDYSVCTTFPSVFMNQVRPGRGRP